MINIRIQTVALLASALLAATSPAYADTDWKTYPGTMCHSDSPVIYNAYGAICSNLSQSADVTVRCPIVRDYGQSRFPTHIRHSGRSGNSSKAVRCSVRSMSTTGSNAGGGMSMSFAYLTYIATGNGVGSSAYRIIDKNTSFASTNSSLLPMHDYGAMVMSCVLPRSQTGGVQPCLTTYSVREWDGK